MKVVLIVNSAASSVTARTRVVIQRALSREHDLNVVETSRRGHATQLAQGAVADGADVVAVLGGDGTLNEAANGLAGSNTALGVIPGGSTNVFARTLGFTNDSIDATAELLQSMKSNNRKRIGLGKANGRYFLFHVGIGFDAAVVSHVERRAKFKRYAGHPLFVWTTFVTWGRYNSKNAPVFSVKFPDDSPNGKDKVDGYLTICLNSNPYTYLGNRPFTVDPRLNFDNGLAVMTLQSLSLPTLMGIVASAMMSGRYLRHHPRTDLRSDVKHCEITGYEKFPYQLDGDYLGDIEHLVLQHEPSVLDLLLPVNKS